MGNTRGIKILSTDNLPYRRKTTMYNEFIPSAIVFQDLSAQLSFWYGLNHSATRSHHKNEAIFGVI